MPRCRPPVPAHVSEPLLDSVDGRSELREIVDDQARELGSREPQKQRHRGEDHVREQDDGCRGRPHGPAAPAQQTLQRMADDHDDRRESERTDDLPSPGEAHEHDDRRRQADQHSQHRGRGRRGCGRRGGTHGARLPRRSSEPAVTRRGAGVPPLCAEAAPSRHPSAAPWPRSPADGRGSAPALAWQPPDHRFLRGSPHAPRTTTPWWQ